MRGITPAQIRKIHILARERGIDNDTLHAHIYTITKKDSIKELSIREAVKVIDSLSGNEDNRMTFKQKIFIFRLAKELGWIDENDEVDTDTLRGFIKKQVNVPTEEWLTKQQASLVIEGLKAIFKKDMEKQNVRD